MVMLLGALTTTVTCPHCPQPIHLDVPVEAYRTTESGVQVQVDMDAVRATVRVHMRQHEGAE
jgi:hypothetical protein